jgi:hypothetical protein
MDQPEHDFSNKLVGIDSPGLTSALSIGEQVSDLTAEILVWEISRSSDRQAGKPARMKITHAFANVFGGGIDSTR